MARRSAQIAVGMNFSRRNLVRRQRETPREGFALTVTPTISSLRHLKPAAQERHLKASYAGACCIGQGGPGSIRLAVHGARMPVL